MGIMLIVVDPTLLVNNIMIIYMNLVAATLIHQYTCFFSFTCDIDPLFMKS